MNIVYNSDDGYAVHTAVSITSIFENNRQAPRIRVFILGNGITKESADRLQTIAGRYETDGIREIRIIDLQEFGAALKLLFGGSLNAGRFTVTALARIFAPQHLPEDVDRYLYLDCDTVTVADLRPLYETDLKGKVCAMVTEPTIYPEVREYLGIGGNLPYYNTGMMLVDRAAWEREEITSKSVDFYRSRNGRLPFSDQDILNYVLKGKALAVGQRWNFFANYYYRSYESLVRQAPWYREVTDKADYEAARRAPAVIHYSGDERPWFRGNHNPWRREYETFLAVTPWTGTPKIRGRELKLQLYHLMNLITGIWPGFRIWISGRYYQNYKKQFGNEP